jgi:hypothetical protein
VSADECQETDYDHRGDCDGRLSVYTLTGFRFGGRPGETVTLCGSHARQARDVAEEKPVLIDPLIADLMVAGMSQTHAMTNRVIENLTRERNELRAELTLIRDGLSDLLHGDFMPTPDAILRRLWPREARVQAQVAMDAEVSR